MKLKIVSFFLFLTQLTFAQIRIGEWVDHLAYQAINSVCMLSNTVYASNGSGIFKYNLDDNSIEKFTKINGLSDVGTKLLRKNPYNNTLLVIYDNSNIDIVKADGTILNISDIKRKVILGKKVINEVYFSGKFAYISCGFGIVVLDMSRLEIKESYYITSGSINLEVYQTTKNDTAIFAATESGVYYGNLNSNLSNFQNWKPLNTGITPGPYNSIVSFKGKILANYSERLNSNQSMKDTIFQYDGISWTKYPYKSNSENIKLLDYSQYNKLMIMDQGGISTFDTTGLLTYTHDYGFGYPNLNDAYYESNGRFWLADKYEGLVKSTDNGPLYNEGIKVNGPRSNLVNDIEINDGTLAVAPTYLGDTYTFQFNLTEPSVYQDKDWKDLRSIIADTLRDFNCVAIDPNNKKHIVYGCMIQGVVDTYNNIFTSIYHSGNSPLLQSASDPAAAVPDLRVTGVNFDKNSNLWVSATNGKNCVNVRKKNGSWVPLNFEQIVVQPTISKIVFDKNNQAWMILPRNGGLLIYKDGLGFSPPTPANTKLATVSQGSGLLPTADVYSICKDLDEHIWIGTSKGVAVFYNPENVFTSSNWDCQQILIEQDGHVQILLENDKITAIAVDGANRKWIGTESSGVYCLSNDGQKEIHHFTEENSPIYSNSVKDIVADETTGDIFIATEKGIQTYRTPIIKGFESFTNVHAYPNPVRPGFSGTVYVTGLIDEAIVKITDSFGNLVWQTKSEGGQVEWNLQNLSGTKVSSGVYLIYCASTDGEKSATSKLLVVN